MDQVKTIAFAIWQQRFWVLSVIGMLVAVYCWNTATADLETKFSSRKSNIEGNFSKVNKIKNEAFHPNEEINNAGIEQVEAQKVLVGKLWNELYQQQKTAVLSWPELGNNFAEKMKELGFLDEIEFGLREQYRNYIKTQFEDIRKIVKASEAEADGMRRRFDPSEGDYGDNQPVEEKPVEDFLVDWLDQTVLKNRLAFQDNKMPSSVKVWVIQEDIWVYENLLGVIAKTNDQHGATRPENTAIRRIINLQVGSSAIKENLRKEKIFIPGASDTNSFQDFSEATPERESEEFGVNDGESDDAILDQRYLNESGQPVSGASGNFGREYRKLPVRMVLLMDQRMIPQVLVECANAPLPIEVTRLSVNRQQSNSTGFEGYRSNRPIRGPGSYGQFENIRNLSTIEIQGNVLIYQPPEEAYMPKEVAEDNTVAETTAEPTT